MQDTTDASRWVYIRQRQMPEVCPSLGDSSTKPFGTRCASIANETSIASETSITSETSAANSSGGPSDSHTSDTRSCRSGG